MCVNYKGSREEKGEMVVMGEEEEDKGINEHRRSETGKDQSWKQIKLMGLPGGRKNSNFMISHFVTNSKNIMNKSLSWIKVKTIIICIHL